jgi:tyrosyl-tRNA synthetase
LLKRIQSKQPIRVVWRLSLKGHVHLGYLMPLIELRRLKQLGCECSVLISDLGGFLDGVKCAWNLREKRLKYCERMVREFLNALGLKDVPIRHSDEHQFKRFIYYHRQIYPKIDDHNFLF